MVGQSRKERLRHESSTEQGYPALGVQILDRSQGGNQVLIPDLAHLARRGAGMQGLVKAQLRDMLVKIWFAR